MRGANGFIYAWGRMRLEGVLVGNDYRPPLWGARALACANYYSGASGSAGTIHPFAVTYPMTPHDILGMLNTILIKMRLSEVSFCQSP
jgi:hypothetical protein